MNSTLEKKHKKTIENIPEIHNLTNVFLFLNKNKINSDYLNILKDFSTLNDDIIAGWLNINSRTFRNYKKTETELKDNTQEHVIMLISLYKHGVDVFGNNENFDLWLSTENLFLGNRKPMDFLDTISGIQFIDDRLTSLEYGDNV